MQSTNVKSGMGQDLLTVSRGTSPCSAYTDVDCCDRARSIDALLEKFCSERETWLQLLLHDPERLSEILWSSWSPISIDTSCLFQMGRGQRKKDPGFIFLKAVRCPQCRQMDRIVNLLNWPLGLPFTMECGDEVGSSLVIRERGPLHQVKMRKDDVAGSERQSLFAKHALLLSCLNESMGQNSSPVKNGESQANSNQKEEYYQCDPFTNEVLIMSFINDYLDFHNIPTTNRLHTAFVCGQYGYLLEEAPEPFNIQGYEHEKSTSSIVPQDRITPKIQIEASLRIVEGIWYQLFSTLHCLSKHQFTHGTLDRDSITLVRKGCDYDYDGIRIAYDFTLKLGNFRLSSITIYDRTPDTTPMTNHLTSTGQGKNRSAIAPAKESTRSRLYPREYISDRHMSKINPEDLPELFKKTGGAEGMNGTDLTEGTYYQPTVSNRDLLFTIRHHGIPLFGSSFDVYGFIIMLMTRKDFYDAVHAHPLLKKVWSIMFSPEDQGILQDRLKPFHLGSVKYDVSNLTDYLRGLQLRCDVLPAVWSILKARK